MMKADWKPNWTEEKRIPKFANGTENPTLQFGPQLKVSWGNMPAIDLINIRKNEDTGALDKDFAILFAASGDFRNMLKSAIGLPEGYTGQCSMTINDIDFDVVARNAIFLLCSFYLDPEEASPEIIHLWYSAFLPAPMLAMLQEKVLPQIEDVCTKIANKAENVPLSKTFKLVSGQTLRFVFTKSNWNRLQAFLKVPAHMTADKVNAVRLARMNHPSRIDYKQKTAYSQWPAFRTCNEKFRQECILLPFATTRQDFNLPNPTMLQSLPEWPFRDDAEPHCGWAHEDVLTGAQLAKDDMLGSLFFMLRGMLLTFCKRVQTINMKFRLYCLDARDLPNRLELWKEEVDTFDRIEVSNIADRGYLGPSTTISVYAPLLRSLADNPHATLLLLFQGAVVEIDRCISPDQRMRGTMATDTLRYMTMPHPSVPRWNADAYRFMQLADGLRDWDKLWAMFEEEVKMPALVAAAGLRQRKKEDHTLTKAWPKRMPKGGSQKEFDLVAAKYSTGFERYVELVRKDIVDGFARMAI